MKKIRKMPIILIISMIMMVLFAPYAYAEFTRQYNPEVRDFAITVATHDNMLISDDEGKVGSFKDSIKVDKFVDFTKPLTPIVGKVTDETTDDAFKAIHFSLEDPYKAGDDKTADSNQYYTIPLYFLGNRDMNVYLAGNNTGVFVRENETNPANSAFQEEHKDKLISQLRVAFLTYSTTYTGNEPGYSSLPVAVNIYSQTKVSEGNYTTFDKLGYSNSSEDTVLATVEKDKITKVTVIIWLEDDGSLEGIDASCGITLSIRFQAVPIEN